MNFFDRFQTEHILIAHRGNSFFFPENTKIAFENALSYANMIELDVTLTKDKQIVVIHDDTLERTSNAQDIFPNRDTYCVSDFLYKELLDLDFSSWFNTSIAPQKIMLLEDVLEFSRTNNISLNVELKDIISLQCNTILTKRVYELLNKYKMTQDVLISSFNHSYLEELKNLNQNISTAALFEEASPNDLLNYLKFLAVDSFHIDISLVDKKLIDQLKKENIFTNVYTINDKKSRDELFKLGVKGIFCDKNIL